MQPRALARHELWGTGTTGARVRAETGLEIASPGSWLLGGDRQIGAMIAEDRLDMLIRCTDPPAALPHVVDVKALLRLSTLKQTVIARTAATADFVIRSVRIGTTVRRRRPGRRAIGRLAGDPVNIAADRSTTRHRGVGMRNADSRRWVMRSAGRDA